MRKLELLALGIAVAVIAYLLLRHDPSADLLRDAAAELNNQSRVIAQLDHANDSLKKAQRKIDTIYIQQRGEFRQTDSAYKAAPTKTVHDTVWVPKVAADADVRACSLVLFTCEQRATLAEQRASNRDSAATAAEDMARKAQAVADGVTVAARKQRWQWGFTGFGAGAASCTLLSLLHR